MNDVQIKQKEYKEVKKLVGPIEHRETVLIRSAQGL